MRLALSSEYARSGLKAKYIRDTLEIKSSGDLTQIVGLANEKLDLVFGMRLIRLPGKASKTAKGPQGTQATSATQAATPATQNSGNQAEGATQTVRASTFSADTVFILQSVLPDAFRNTISEQSLDSYDSKYMGVVTLLVSIISFSGGSLEEPVLLRYVKDLGLEQMLKATSLQSVEDALKIMQKHMYIEKESSTVRGDQMRKFVKYHLGRRAIREFSRESLIMQCQAIMGESFNDSMVEQLESVFEHCGILSAADIPQLFS